MHLDATLPNAGLLELIIILMDKLLIHCIRFRSMIPEPICLGTSGGYEAQDLRGRGQVRRPRITFGKSWQSILPCLLHVAIFNNSPLPPPLGMEFLFERNELSEAEEPLMINRFTRKRHK